MKPTHLITLSARIKELHEFIVFNKIDLEQFFQLTLDANKQAKTIVKIGQFVAAENGVPLDKPLSFRCGNETQKQCSQELEPCECAALNNQYNEAQKSVIFEGWEVLKPNRFGDFVVHNKEYNTTLEFLENGINCKVYFGLNQSMNTHVKSLADLAAATTENPLKLK